MRIKGHQDDVNAIAYLDDSNNVLISGSDDTEIKVCPSRRERMGKTHYSERDRFRLSAECGIAHAGGLAAHSKCLLYWFSPPHCILQCVLILLYSRVQGERDPCSNAEDECIRVLPPLTPSLPGLWSGSA